MRPILKKNESMSTKRFIVYLILLSIALPSPGKNRYSIHEDNYHFGYVSAAGGYTSLSHRANTISTKGNFGYLFGLGYEFRRHNFWVSSGLQFQSLSSSVSVDEYVYTSPVGGMDDLGRKVNEYRYTVNQRDEQDWKTIDIPIEAGYYNNGFYVGAGFKVAFPAYNAGKVKGTYDVDAVYDRYVGVISDVQYYKTYPYESKSYSYRLRPMFSVLGEIGYDVLSSMANNDVICHMLKIGLYFEYGLRSVKSSPVTEPVEINPNNAVDVTIHPYFATEKSANSWTVPYFVGLKLTYMVGGSRSATSTWHKGCQCYGY